MVRCKFCKHDEAHIRKVNPSMIVYYDGKWYEQNHSAYLCCDCEAKIYGKNTGTGYAALFFKLHTELFVQIGRVEATELQKRVKKLVI